MGKNQYIFFSICIFVLKIFFHWHFFYWVYWNIFSKLYIIVFNIIFLFIMEALLSAVMLRGLLGGEKPVSRTAMYVGSVVLFFFSYDFGWNKLALGRNKLQKRSLIFWWIMAAFVAVCFVLNIYEILSVANIKKWPENYWFGGINNDQKIIDLSSKNWLENDWFKV